jgi:hypothetical protein
MIVAIAIGLTGAGLICFLIFFKTINFFDKI